MRLKVVAFDLDGTLADNMTHATDAYRMAFAHVTGRPWRDEEVYRLYGPNCEGMCMAAAGDRWPEALERFYAEFRRAYEARSAVVPGVREMLEALGAAGVKLALISGGSRGAIDITLEHVGLTGFFGQVRSGSVHGVDKAACIGEILSHYGEAAADAAYVGDAPYDVKAAAEAGVLPIRCAWTASASGFHPRAHDPPPAAVFERVGDFLAWMKDG